MFYILPNLLYGEQDKTKLIQTGVFPQFSIT